MADPMLQRLVTRTGRAVDRVNERKQNRPDPPARNKEPRHPVVVHGSLLQSDVLINGLNEPVEVPFHLRAMMIEPMKKGHQPCGISRRVIHPVRQFAAALQRSKFAFPPIPPVSLNNPARLRLMQFQAQA